MVRTTPSLCSGCQICSLICAWTKFQVNNPKRGFIRIEDNWPGESDILVCQACHEHDCLVSCPTGALTWQGHVKLDEDLCSGCGDCVSACPVGGIHLDPASDHPLICDTCADEYLCVQWCPTGALTTDR